MDRLHYSPQAMNDLDEIWTYILEDLKNPASARSTIAGIEVSVECILYGSRDYLRILFGNPAEYETE